MSSGRIERGVISIAAGRDGGASLAELHDRRQDARPGMYGSWREAGRRLGAIMGLWACGGWFFSMMVRGREVAGWEIAGLLVGLVAVSVVAEEREAKEERDAE